MGRFDRPTVESKAASAWRGNSARSSGKCEQLPTIEQPQHARVVEPGKRTLAVGRPRRKTKVATSPREAMLAVLAALKTGVLTRSLSLSLFSNIANTANSASLEGLAVLPLIVADLNGLFAFWPPWQVAEVVEQIAGAGAALLSTEQQARGIVGAMVVCDGTDEGIGPRAP